MPPLMPLNPEEVVVIRQLVPGVISTLSAPFWRFGLIRVGGRSTVIRLRTGALAVFSPIALTPSVERELRTLSNSGNNNTSPDTTPNVRYLIAPDLEHHIHLPSWHRAFPTAKILAPSGLPEKYASSSTLPSTLPFHTVQNSTEGNPTVDPPLPADFTAEFDLAFLPAHPNRELVLHHRPTATLLEADLLFTLPAAEQFSRCGPDGLLSRLLTRFFVACTHVRGDARAQRWLMWYVFSARDREGFARGVRRVDGWSFDRLVPCHGEVVEGGGKEVFRRVMRWHLEGKAGKKKE